MEKKLRNKLRFRASAADQALMWLHPIVLETPLEEELEIILREWKEFLVRLFEETADV